MKEKLAEFLIYVSGPYTKPDPCANVNKAIQMGNQLLDLGFSPVVPHLLHLWHTVTPRHYTDWMQIDLALVVRCDALLRLPGLSPGADEEVNAANDCGIPVFYDLEELKSYFYLLVNDMGYAEEMGE
jgi:hypothetical protein